MIINDLDILDSKTNFLEEDVNGRSINLYNLTNVRLTGNSLFYPNILLHSDDKIYQPIREKIMSLKSLKSDDEYEYVIEDNKTIYESPVFFFIYNVDNYYHYVYDTLPYLISFGELKKTNKDIKLLMNYSVGKTEFYKFVVEFLDILGISKDDIVIADKNTLYKSVYVSSSYTHDNDSNIPPRKEIYELYKRIVEVIRSNYSIDNLPKKIYVSRRTWVHNDLSNIGTNYTSRRKLEIEDELVKVLVRNGYTEVFTENLSTVEKVLMFSNADIVIGAIGGGLCNVLFSGKDTKLISLISPTFLEVNSRFVYSFSNVDTVYFKDTLHTDIGDWKKYMRVKFGELIGEVEDVFDDTLIVSYTNQRVAGWNSEIKFDRKIINKSDCVKLDGGLNSSWTFKIDDLIKHI